MALKKKKISRKELLKKPDEFITTSNKIYAWVSDNYQKVLMVLLVAVVVAGVVLGYLGYRSHRESQAHQKYFSALELTDPPKKIKALQELTAEYAGTRGAAQAWISLGHLYFQQKNFAQAEQAYRQALDLKGFPDSVQSLIQESLAYTLEEKGDLKGAVAGFSQIIRAADPFLKENAYLSLARVYVKLGQSKEAKTALQDFLKAFPNSNYAPLVRDRLARL
jgi:predicted negative regulator of RcsB-dependent stress response